MFQFTKKKGSKDDPNNYRGVTLLSCLGKYFTSILNSRFKKVSDKLISNIQAGFREGFSTMDHVFTIVSIINLYQKMGIDLYVAFIDYAKAFDTIWRDGLWYKLVKEGIGGKFLCIIKNMYEKSKSCVLINSERSQFFSSLTGVKQGEILSPLLFAFYINDLEEFLKSKHIKSLANLSKMSEGIAEHMGLQPNFIMDLIALYYAEDTLILAESPADLQDSLHELFIYCQKWKLKVNEDKTKILCFTNKRKNEPTFFYNDQKLENVKDFVYLGVTLTNKGISQKSVQARIPPTHRAIFSTLSMCRANELPIDLTLDLFHKIVAPCTLYGAEIFGFKSCNQLECLQHKYLKYALKLKNSTSTAMLLGETGFLPLEYYIKIKMVGFWVSIISGNREKLSYKMYFLCLTLYNDGMLEFEWLHYIKSILDECGLTYIFENQLGYEHRWLKNFLIPKVKLTLKDLFLQKWRSDVENSQKCFYYKHLYAKPMLQKYLKILPQSSWIPIIKFKTANHRLPIEIYSWQITYKDRNKRLCTMCNSGDIGDEYHYLIVCPMFQEARVKFLKKYFYVKPSVFKFLQLINSEQRKELVNLSKFLKILFSVFK